MNFLVEGDISFYGLNKIIFEYLKFGPFLDELLEVMDDVKEYLDKKIDVSYTDKHLTVENKKWSVGYFRTRNRYDYLKAVFSERNNKLGIKNNSHNFYFHYGMNLCYVDY